MFLRILQPMPILFIKMVLPPAPMHMLQASFLFPKSHEARLEVSKHGPPFRPLADINTDEPWEPATGRSAVRAIQGQSADSPAKGWSSEPTNSKLCHVAPGHPHYHQIFLITKTMSDARIQPLFQVLCGAGFLMKHIPWVLGSVKSQELTV